MSILIKGMEIPEDHPLWIVVHSDGTVEANDVSASRPVGWQTLRNAAVHVPPHGRLIDADALCKTLRSLAENEYTPEVFANWIENHIDTIIPAEPVGESET